jgi:hypothetical protein
MSLLGSTSKWCVALGFGGTGFGGGKALAADGGSLGAGWNSEHPPVDSAPKHTAQATVLRDTVLNKVATGSIYSKVGRSGN